MTTTRFDVGTLLWVKSVSFAGAPGGKRAPGVVLSSHKYHQERPDIVLARLTSKMHHQSGFAAVTIPDWAACGLDKPSVIKPFVFTVEQSQIESVIGHLDADTVVALKKAFKTVFPFAS